MIARNSIEIQIKLLNLVTACTSISLPPCSEVISSIRRMICTITNMTVVYIEHFWKTYITWEVEHINKTKHSITIKDLHSLGFFWNGLDSEFVCSQVSRVCGRKGLFTALVFPALQPLHHSLLRVGGRLSPGWAPHGSSLQVHTQTHRDHPYWCPDTAVRVNIVTHMDYSTSIDMWCGCLWVRGNLWFPIIRNP